ncbi:unnamed protein product [Brachionus calyciflorus]|uniref:Peroxisomal biogenesis factor 3 n=1 Tax=Brachionus calyciflorus TaxID=104777 RepID=A0A814MJH7_9BILA|nr:unnamed protein product [Brachionus calyciflorus]
MSFVAKFGKRHKKKLIFSAILFGGGYATVKYSIHRFKKALLMSSEDADLVNKQYEKSQKLQHYYTIKKTSDEAIRGLLKSIENQISIALSSDEYLEQLKHKAPNKLELWEKIKISSISKCLSTIYSLTISTILIKVQLNIIGGYLFKSSSSESTFLNFEKSLISEEKLSPNIQKKYLENIEIFVSEGIPKLCAQVKNCVVCVFEKLSLKENIDIAYFNEKLESVRENVEALNGKEINFINELLNLRPNKPKDKEINEIILAEKKNSENNDEGILLDNLNNETFDLVQSDDFIQTFCSIFDSYKNEFLNNLSSLILKQKIDKNESEKISLSLPLAKLIPILNQMKLTCDFNILENNLKLNIFSSNIYEAFCYVPEDRRNSDPLSGIDVNMILKSLI